MLKPFKGDLTIFKDNNIVDFKDQRYMSKSEKITEIVVNGWGSLVLENCLFLIK